jgi:hypothetical protein
MKRREFITLVGGTVIAWPLAARSQQAALPVVGYLNFGSPESDAFRLTGLRRGLNQSGYVEGRNLVIEYRWAGNQADRLQALAADLVQLRVDVIVSPGLLSTLAAQGCNYQHFTICLSKKGRNTTALQAHALSSMSTKPYAGASFGPDTACSDKGRQGGMKRKEYSARRGRIKTGRNGHEMKSAASGANAVANCFVLITLAASD